MAMKSHHYRITVEHTADPQGNVPNPPASVQFNAANHDELLGIIARIRARGEFDADTSASFALGLKLLGEVMLTHRDHPLFTELGPAFGQFMKRLKGRPPETAQA